MKIGPVEKGVSIPTRANVTRDLYPYAEMEVGDSFGTVDIAHEKLRSSCYSYGKKHGMKFLVRKLDDSKCRVWRVA